MSGETSLQMALISGLAFTLAISGICVLIGIIPGTTLYMGINSKYRIIRMICRVYMYLFDGIPLLAQLYFIYYGLPIISPALTLSQYSTGIIILSLNAIAQLPSVMKTYANRCNSFVGMHKLLAPASISLFSKLIKYSTLVSIIAIPDLMRIGIQIMSKAGKPEVFAIVIIIYLVINIIFKLIAEGIFRLVLHNSMAVPEDISAVQK